MIDKQSLHDLLMVEFDKLDRAIKDNKAELPPPPRIEEPPPSSLSELKEKYDERLYHMELELVMAEALAKGLAVIEKGYRTSVKDLRSRVESFKKNVRAIREITDQAPSGSLEAGAGRPGWPKSRSP